MSFLIGLGIIVAIVYANSLYDHIKEKKAKKAEEQAAVGVASETEHLEAAAAVSAAPDCEVSERAADANRFSELADYIAAQLKAGRYIFGVPMQLCEQDESGKVIALDREDNIYVIETKLRPEYQDFYDQVKADRAAERKRISKGADERKVYGLVCTMQPSELLVAAAQKDTGIRIYRYCIYFENII
jgi:hypothetical protein